MQDFWNFKYKGAFRVGPNTTLNGSRFGYGGDTMAINSKTNTLWMEGHAHHQKVAEVNIPELKILNNVKELSQTEILTPFIDVSLGKIIGQLGGLAFDEDRIWWTSEQYYDVSPTVYPSIGWTNLEITESHGPWMCDVGNKLTERYITLIPKDIANKHFNGWRILCGQAGVSGTAGSSQGPCLTLVETPTEDGQVLKTVKLLFYHQDKDRIFIHPVDGKPWGRADHCSSVQFIDNWVVFFVRRANGLVYYGSGNMPPEGGEVDQCAGAKGYHGYPYEYGMYVYHLDDLLKVYNKEIESWQVQPRDYIIYGTELYQSECTWTATGYNPLTKEFYLSEPRADRYIYESLPTVHVFDYIGSNPQPDDDCVELKTSIARLQAELLLTKESLVFSSSQITDLQHKIDAIRGIVGV